MKNIYRYLLLIVVSMHATVALAQHNAGLCFRSEVVDVGHVAEEGGTVVALFCATNISANAIEIVNVATTCGCTTASYSSGTIAPNEEFQLEVRFDPRNRPGRIDKYIYVSTTEGDNGYKLCITGYVTPRERSVDELYPFDMGGGLRLISTFHAFGIIEHGKGDSYAIVYINTSDRELMLSFTKEGYEHSIVNIPTTLAPHATGDITIGYALAESECLYGTLANRISLYVNGVECEYPIITECVAVDNFDLTDDISAPCVDISKNIIKFGDVKCTTEILEQSILITNVGVEPLAVRSVECSSKAVVCIAKPMESIDAGDSGEIVLRLYASRIEDWDNPFTARVRIVTNDPIRPLRTIKVNALPVMR